MSKRFFAYGFTFLLLLGLATYIVPKSTEAEQKETFSFNILETISNENFDKLTDNEKIDYLTKLVNRKDKIINSLQNSINNKTELKSIKDIFDAFTLKTIEKGLKEKLDTLVVHDDIIEDPLKLDLKPVSDTQIENVLDTPAMSTEENVESKIMDYVTEKNTISNYNYLYKISTDPTIISVLHKSFDYENNIPLLAKRWGIDNINTSYSDIVRDPNQYQTNEKIIKYLTCINQTISLCSDYEGKKILLGNINNFVALRTDELAQVASEKETEEIIKTMNEKTKPLTVTSYNPECSQTKGGIMGKDGYCYGTKKAPCAVGNNKGKTSGLCGNPYIGAKGHNLKFMLESGIKPIAVTQDMQDLIGSKVYLKCYDKNGQESYDERCSGYFTVYDYKHDRFQNSVDVFINEKDENGRYKNIGGVTVEIYHN